MHDCPRCGQACDCDLEDTWLEAPVDCICDCEGYYDSEDDYEDWAEDAYPELLLEDDSDSLAACCPSCGFSILIPDEETGFWECPNCEAIIEF
jgi:hypothetical protein